MKEDAKKKPEVSLKCPNCTQAVRFLGKLKSGRDTVKLYRCSYCQREFIEEELRSSSKSF